MKYWVEIKGWHKERLLTTDGDGKIALEVANHCGNCSTCKKRIASVKEALELKNIPVVIEDRPGRYAGGSKYVVLPKPPEGTEYWEHIQELLGLKVESLREIPSVSVGSNGRLGI